MADFTYIESTGVIVADTADIRAQVEAEYREVFGEDFIVDPATPEGALITAEITSRQSVARNNAALANQINPAQSDGVFLDAIYALFGGERDAQTKSTVQCTCAGVAGTIIPIGTRARSTADDIWIVSVAATIPASGSVSVSFEAEEYGPILASAGTIINIVDNSVLGWESVTNPSAASAGVSTQNDSSTRIERKQRLAIQSRSTPEAIQARLTTVTGYRSHQFRENIADTSQVIDGITLAPHSIWVCVNGGGDSEIANVLSLSKSDGAGWNGAVSVAVMDEFSEQTQNVLFDRPDEIPLAIRVTVKASSGTDISNDIIAAVVNYANGLVDGETGFIVGQDVSPFEVGAAVNSEVSGVYVRLVELSKNPGSPTYETDPIVIAINELPTITEANVSVVLL